MGHLERDMLLIRPTAMARPAPVSNGRIPTKGTANGPHLSRVTSLTDTSLTQPNRPTREHSQHLSVALELDGSGWCSWVAPRGEGSGVEVDREL
jgi:hypothetical protein